MKINRRIKIILKALLLICVIIAVIVYIISSISSPVTQNISNYVYDLPYLKGTKFKVVQGYGGLFTHKNVAALDFAMPVGTKVCAARGGVIYAIKEDSNEGGPFASYKSKANYIIIKHDDGTLGCYWHLKKNSILIKHGKVSKAEVIALSGETGQVLRPHLHFSVKRQLNYEMNSFVRTEFKTNSGNILLERGEEYERPEE